MTFQQKQKMSQEQKRRELQQKEQRASSEEIQTLKTLFDKFDSNHDGRLDKNELKDLMKSMDEIMSNEDIEEMIKQADWDEDGLINFEEFKYQMLD